MYLLTNPRYMANYRCHVTGAKATGAKKVAAAKPAMCCASDSTKCVKGAKQLLAWHRKTENLHSPDCGNPCADDAPTEHDGHNVNTPAGVSPGYNQKMGVQAPGPERHLRVSEESRRSGDRGGSAAPSQDHEAVHALSHHGRGCPLHAAEGHASHASRPPV